MLRSLVAAHCRCNTFVFTDVLLRLWHPHTTAVASELGLCLLNGTKKTWDTVSMY